MRRFAPKLKTKFPSPDLICGQSSQCLSARHRESEPHEIFHALLGQRGTDFLFAAAAADRDPHSLVRRRFTDEAAQLARAGHGFSLKTQNDVVFLQAGFFGRLSLTI